MDKKIKLIKNVFIFESVTKTNKMNDKFGICGKLMWPTM
jgi:hypothetical protein